jgi:hypothetical protein
MVLIVTGGDHFGQQVVSGNASMHAEATYVTIGIITSIAMVNSYVIFSMVIVI